MARQPKWYKEMTDEQREHYWKMHQERFDEGVDVGEDLGSDHQKYHDVAAIILVLRNRMHYTNMQINDFIKAMKEEMEHYSWEDAREIVNAYYHEAEKKLQDKK